MVLRDLVGRCNALCRDADIFARIGGEEFVVLLPETEKEEAIIFAERLRQEIELLSIKYEENALKITISIGVDTFNQDDISHEDIVKRADEFLYHAKESGRNRVAYASD